MERIQLRQLLALCVGLADDACGVIRAVQSMREQNGGKLRAELKDPGKYIPFRNRRAGTFTAKFSHWDADAATSTHRPPQRLARDLSRHI